MEQSISFSLHNDIHVLLSDTIQHLRSKLLNDKVSKEKLKTVLFNVAEIVKGYDITFDISTSSTSSLDDFNVIFSISQNDDIMRKILKFMMCLCIYLGMDITNIQADLMLLEDLLPTVEKYVEIQDMEKVSKEMQCITHLYMWAFDDLKEKYDQVSKGKLCERATPLLLSYLKYIRYEMRKCNENNIEWSPNDQMIDLFASIYHYLPFGKWYWKEWDVPKEVQFEFLEVIYDLGEYPDFSDSKMKIYELCNNLLEDGISKVKSLVERDVELVKDLEPGDVIHGIKVWKMGMKIATSLSSLSQQPPLSPSVLFVSQHMVLIMNTLKYCLKEPELKQYAHQLLDIVKQCFEIITPSRADQEEEEKHFQRLEECELFKHLIEVYYLSDKKMKESVLMFIHFAIQFLDSIETEEMKRIITFCVNENSTPRLDILFKQVVRMQSYSNKADISDRVEQLFDSIEKSPVDSEDLYSDLAKISILAIRDNIDKQGYVSLMLKKFKEMKSTFKSGKYWEEREYWRILRIFCNTFLRISRRNNEEIEELNFEIIEIIENLYLYTDVDKLDNVLTDLFGVVNALFIQYNPVFTERITPLIFKLFLEKNIVDKEVFLTLIQNVLIYEITTKSNPQILKQIESNLPQLFDFVEKNIDLHVYLIVLAIVYPFFPKQILPVFKNTEYLTSLIRFIGYENEESSTVVSSELAIIILGLVDDILEGMESDSAQIQLTIICELEDYIIPSLELTGTYNSICNSLIERIRHRVSISQKEPGFFQMIDDSDSDSWEDI